MILAPATVDSWPTIVTLRLLQLVYEPTVTFASIIADPI